MGCFTFVKVMMILFNLMIFLGGGALLGVGIWVTVDGSSFVKVIGQVSSQAMQFVNVGYFCIAIGAVLVLIGFLGCCGAQKESRCLLIMFFAIVLIIFIAEIAAAVVALVYSSFAESLLKAWVGPVLKNDYGKVKDVTGIWNSTMSELKCCGFTNYTDFIDSYYYENNNNNLPSFCCTGLQSNCSIEVASTDSVQGCFEQLFTILKENANIVGGIAAGICALEIAAMAVSMYLYCKIDDKTSV
ncbi:tetraspanin-1 [Callorhinchus milii]|uniref:Tetraspanin n=1 Tax=Callorhinchus milii TaxID=7868 RepID=A0A4W3HZR7_CALMI|nr:tetraspanin-1 [Callorhinchus milii]XP_042191724.1 tetraspanin-1 [Callorhinchus milii]|eukprot:gi/632963751/ref/XP_007898059.1/ PREDICTED: tetraspanin-1 [Callorhinchus milii]